MDHISSYSSRYTSTAQASEGNNDARSSRTSLSRDSRSRASLAPTADRISNAPSLARSRATNASSERSRSLHEARLSHIREQKSERSRREDEFFETAMSQKFPRDGVSRTSMSGSDKWVPGVRSEMPGVSQERFDYAMSQLKVNDPEQYSQWSTIDEIRGGRAKMLRQEHSDYKSGKSSSSSYHSHEPAGRSSSSHAGSSRTGYSNVTRREMDEFDRTYMGQGLNVSAPEDHTGLTDRDKERIKQDFYSSYSSKKGGRRS